MNKTIEKLNQRTQNFLEKSGFENIKSWEKLPKKYFTFTYNEWNGSLSYIIYKDGYLTDFNCLLERDVNSYVLYKGQKWVELRYKLKEFSRKVKGNE